MLFSFLCLSFAFLTTEYSELVPAKISLTICIKLGLPQSTKRENVYDSNNVWIDTRPIDVIDLGNKDANTIYKYELLTQNEESVHY